MAQFGLSGDPTLSAEWRAKPIKDEKVIESNQKGYLTFAKTGAPDSRTTQLFINYGVISLTIAPLLTHIWLSLAHIWLTCLAHSGDNARLDGMGFAPFAKILGDGMAVVEDICEFTSAICRCASVVWALF